MWGAGRMEIAQKIPTLLLCPAAGTFNRVWDFKKKNRL